MINQDMLDTLEEFWRTRIEQAKPLLIDNGQQQSSYREFTVTLEAGQVYNLTNPFNYFRCLEASSQFELAWSTNLGNTTFEAGLGIKLPKVIPYAQIFAPADQPLTVRIGCGIGEFDDSRLTVSGTVRTEPAQYASFEVSTLTIADGSVTVPVAQKVIIQNTGANVMYIGGAGTDGLQLQPQGTFETEVSSELTVYGTDDDTLVVGEWN